MNTDGPKSHLSQIETQWTAVFQAHKGRPDEASEAQTALMRRYGGAVHRYLLASLRDPEAAADLAQEFALKFLRGDFRRADPDSGRFRDFLKRAIYHLMIDYHRARRKSPRPLADDVPEPTQTDDPWARDLDRQFLDGWRDELMARAWVELDRVQERTGRPFAAILRMRVAHPELHSPDLAVRLSEALGRPLTAGWVRQNLHRARDLFVEFLLREVAQSLGDAAPERVEEELEALGLLDYCRPALKRIPRDP